MKQIGINLVKISMNLPVNVWKRLKLRAVHENTTATNIVVRIIEEHLGKRKKKEAR